GRGIGGMLATNKVSAGADAWIAQVNGLTTPASGALPSPVTPGSQVTLNAAYGTATWTATGGASHTVTIAPGTNVAVVDGYATPDVTANGGSQSVAVTPGEIVEIGAGYLTPAGTASAAGTPQPIALTPGSLVAVSDGYGTVARYATGSGTVVLHDGDAVVVSAGYAGGGIPGTVYVWGGGD